MVEEAELAAALRAGIKLEFIMFDYYDSLLPRMTGLEARRAIAGIRLQELDHLETTDVILKGILSTPSMYSSQVPPFSGEQAKVVSPHMRPNDILSLKVPDALRVCYSFERYYESAYSKIFSGIRDTTTKMRLMVMVTESRTHADSLGSILKGMGEEVPKTI